VEQIAACLDMLADASESRSANHETVELVMTAPADSDAYHRDTKVVVTDLFRRAEKAFWLQDSPFTREGGSFANWRLE
jgi:hypothetical protein